MCCSVSANSRGWPVFGSLGADSYFELNKKPARVGTALALLFYLVLRQPPGTSSTGEVWWFLPSPAGGVREQASLPVNLSIASLGAAFLKLQGGPPGAAVACTLSSQSALAKNIL